MTKPGKDSRLWVREIAIILGVWVSMLSLLSTALVWAGAPIQITSISNPSVQLQINAYGGSYHGTTLKAVTGCPAGNTDCAWTLLPNGMIVSDSDPTLAWNAYGGAKHGTDITLVRGCQPNLTDCTWTVRDDGLIVSNTNPQLAVNAYGGAKHLAPLKLVNNCAPELDGCKWVGSPSAGWPTPGPNSMLYSAETNNVFGVNAYGGAKHKTELQVVAQCPEGNTDCMWRFRSDGMIISASNAALAWNAYGGAKVGTKITLVVGCPSNNTDCQWDRRPDGMIVSRTNPNLAVKAQGGPHHIAPLVLANDCTPAVAGCMWSTGSIARQGNRAEVWGFADLHTHPASFLAFGSDANGENGIFHGKPGLKLSDASATILDDLKACIPDKHSGFTLDPAEHLIRKELMKHVDEMGHWPHEASGAPEFKNWPAAQSINHQQMHISDIRRAYDGGLRLLVASATNNQLLHIAWHANVPSLARLLGSLGLMPAPEFDFNSAIVQINFIKTLVSSNSDWMEIALTPQQARSAIGAGKLAIILGLEMDALTLDQILMLVKDHGVRLVLPIHLANNEFGGSAIYDDFFNLNTEFFNGQYFSVEFDSALTFRLKNPDIRISNPLGGTSPPEVLNYSRGSGGHKNALGLNGGGSAILTLMKKGLLLDLAHMGNKSIEESLGLAERFGFPLMDSHTALRDERKTGSKERDLSFSQTERIAKLGGVIGLGTTGDLVAPIPSRCNVAGRDQCFAQAEPKYQNCILKSVPRIDRSQPLRIPTELCDSNRNAARSSCEKQNNCQPLPVSNWLDAYNVALDHMGNRGVALGTDANGLSPLFPPASGGTVVYPFLVAREYAPPATVVSSMSNRRIGSRVYDFHSDGLATYGMLPDFLQALNIMSAPYDPKRALKALYHSAEDTIQMWEKAEQASQRIPPSTSSSPSSSTTQPVKPPSKKKPVDPDNQPLSEGQSTR